MKMSSSEEENTGFSSGEESEVSLNTSEESFFSAAGNFAPYGENLEPIATEEEASEYASQAAAEEEEEQLLLSRFSGEVEDWCQCSNCSLNLVVTPDECRCCLEIRRCTEKMEEVEKDGQCITLHPGFESVCLNRWVLHTAGIGLKTKAKKSYTTMLTAGDGTEAEFLRSVAYRQFVRLVWEYLGMSKRLPLPCCVYNAIRSAFPTAAEDYHGYEEEEEDED